MPEKWEQLVAAARQERDDVLARLEPPVPELPADEQLPKNVTHLPRTLLSSEEIAITESPLPELLSSLSTGKVSAVSVTKAFLRRAALAQKLVNCIFELVPDEALDRAHELDVYYEQNKRPVGPLHGLPISLKALLPWPGRRSNEGFVADLANKCSREASIVTIVRSLGAIPFARTTQCQAVMMLENLGPIHGSTSNPHNSGLTPGGSTGGEGALLALFGSPLGIGTDIGGSVRSPAANCGLYTLKPSSFRLPMTGLHVYFTGSDMVLGNIGPMTPSREGIEIFMKSVLGTKPWEGDPGLVPLPWREHEDPAGSVLNIGVLWDDGIVQPSKAMTRALKEVVDKLESDSTFKISNWEPYKHADGLDILAKLYAPDGGEEFLNMIAESGEPVHDLTDYRLVSGPGVEKLSVKKCWDWAAARNAFRYNYLQEWLTKAPEMDVILCPPHPGAAPPIGSTKYWGYTSIWNLLDYPAAVFPVSRVDPRLDHEDAGHVPRNEVDDWTHQHFDAERQAGAPICLQVVGKRLQEEKVVHAMNRICDAAGLPFVDCLRSEI